mmetsp:Transcript_139974/g.247393  ORF Transcript_139974/g.247393 Transcript_139974/m.247393 type:complete len:229 (+) Transcript_139974:1779-2465(+)
MLAMAAAARRSSKMRKSGEGDNRCAPKAPLAAESMAALGEPTGACNGRAPCEANRPNNGEEGVAGTRACSTKSRDASTRSFSTCECSSARWSEQERFSRCSSSCREEAARARSSSPMRPGGRTPFHRELPLPGRGGGAGIGEESGGDSCAGATGERDRGGGTLLATASVAAGWAGAGGGRSGVGGALARLALLLAASPDAAPPEPSFSLGAPSVAAAGAADGRPRRRR